MLLRQISFLGSPDSSRYPLGLPLFRAPFSLRLERPVTFFAGDNGSGKSTLLEGIAAACELATAGAHDVETDDSLAPARELGAHLRLGWNARTRNGFFLRSEDFFGFQKRTDALRDELAAQIAGYEAELETNPNDEGVRRAMGYIAAQKRELEATFGPEADAHSHGEAFFRFFENRLAPRGLYLLDEPEAPLSPIRQLALLSLIKSAVGAGSQFLIASHSPLLLAMPDAQIFDFNAHPPAPCAWDDLESVRFWQQFLAAPQAFLRRI